MLIPGSVVKAAGKEKLFTKRPTCLGFPVFRHVLLAAMGGQGFVGKGSAAGPLQHYK